MRTLLGTALVMTAGLLLTGCGGGDEPSTQPSETPSTEGSAEPSPSASESASGDPSSNPSSSGSLPASYPVAEVPIIEGEIGEVLENADRGSYLIKVYPDTEFPEAFATATDLLTSAGFTIGKDIISVGPTSSTADFTSEDWLVVVTGGLPGRTIVQYTVYPND